MRSRFRTTVEIGGVPTFWEDRLLRDAGDAVPFRLGAVELLGVNPCQRCVVPARDPPTGTLDGDFALRFAELRKRTRPAWSDPARFDHFFRVAVNTRPGASAPGDAFAVGDTVSVRGAAGDYASPEDRADDFRAGGMVVEVARNETPDVRTFRLRWADGGAPPFRFKAGQFVSVVVGQGGERLRASSTKIIVPATRIEVSGPNGDFGFDGREAGEVLFIAGGIGITPLMSKLRYLADAGWVGRVDLVQVTRRREDLVFADELVTLPERLPGLRVHAVLTSPDGAWRGLRGRLTASILSSIVPDVARCQVRICGPLGMAAAARDALRALDVSKDRVESEAFGGPPVAAPDTLARPSKCSAPTSTASA